MHSFAVDTVGCKVNQYETQAVAELLRRLGLRPVRPREQADLLVVNTCCVTTRAAAKSRQALRRAVRRWPGADVLILGCYATADSAVLRRSAASAGAKGRVHVVGHDGDVAGCIRQCAALLGEAGFAEPGTEPQEIPARSGGPSRPGGKLSRGFGRQDTTVPSPAGCVRNDVCMRAEPSASPAGARRGVASASTGMRAHAPLRVKENVGTISLPPVSRFAAHQRAFVKVQDGCDAFCSYCVVPRLRRRVWSRPAEEVLREVEILVAHGHREIVLCGVFLGAYGQDTAVRRRWRRPAALPGLLRRVAATEGLWRVRLSSLDVGDVTDELLAALRDCPTVAPHLHLPLQSGSDAVLRRMNRRYTAGQFLAAVERFASVAPDPAVTTDVLVGFPGESERDFRATLQVARRAGFSRIHVFPFSPRRGTAAWAWRAEAPAREEVRRRCRRLDELARGLADAYRRRFVGRTVEALVEPPAARTPPGCSRALTDRYLEVTFPCDDPAGLVGQVVPVQVTHLAPGGLVGVLAAG